MDELYYIFVETTSHTYVTRERDNSDEWSGEDTDTSWSFGKVYRGRTPNGKSYSDLSILASKEDYDEKELYVVVAVWSTGDSFSSDSCANAEIFSVHHTLEEAQEAKKKLELTGEYNYQSDGKPVDLGNGYVLKSLPWDGYFENLANVEIV